jgi:hypothetical protein
LVPGKPLVLAAFTLETRQFYVAHTERYIIGSIYLANRGEVSGEFLDRAIFLEFAIEARSSPGVNGEGGEVRTPFLS